MPRTVCYRRRRRHGHAAHYRPKQLMGILHRTRGFAYRSFFSLKVPLPGEGLESGSPESPAGSFNNGSSGFSNAPFSCSHAFLYDRDCEILQLCTFHAHILCTQMHTPNAHTKVPKGRLRGPLGAWGDSECLLSSLP